jgi:hypothetical protein
MVLTRIGLCFSTLLAGLLASNALGQEVHDRIHGAAGSAMGRTIAGGSDLDGDGVRDFFVAAPGARSQKGIVRAYSGANRNEIFRIIGPAWRPDGGGPDDFGSALTAVGDLDGDGAEDLLIGVPLDNVGTGFNHGSAYVYSTASLMPIHQFSGTQAQAGLGHGVARMQDVDGDGVQDFAVGAPGDGLGSSQVGAVRVYSGQSGAVLYTVRGTRNQFGFGRTLGAIDDLDGDGLDDLMIGDRDALLLAGQVTVVSGVDGSLLYRVDGLTAGGALSWSMAAIDDVNNDGLQDLLIGAPYGGSDLTGYAMVCSGADGSLLTLYAGANAQDTLGWSVASAGDVNGDGVGDYLVDAPQYFVSSPQIGYANLYSGQTGSLLYRFDSNASGASAGRVVAGLGDLDSDGCSEIAIGKPNAANSAGDPAGRVTLYRGNDFYLHLSTNRAVAGDTLLVGAQGLPFEPVIHAVTALNGAPMFQIWLHGTLNFQGRESQPVTIATSAAGTTVELQSFSLDAAANRIDSAAETLEIH